MSNSGTDGHAWNSPSDYIRRSTSPHLRTTLEDPGDIPPVPESRRAVDSPPADAEEQTPPPAPRRPPGP